MRCPFCRSPLAAGVPECPACRVTFPRAAALLGAVPRLAIGISDSQRHLDAAGLARIKRTIGGLTRRFPQVMIQVVIQSFPPEQPFSLHAFWLFNAASFSGDSHRGADNHTVMLIVDPGRAESALMVGYGLEQSIDEEVLDHLLDLAAPAWQFQRWTDGIVTVLEELDQLLESVAELTESINEGEF